MRVSTLDRSRMIVEGLDRLDEVELVSAGAVAADIQASAMALSTALGVIGWPTTDDLKGLADDIWHGPVPTPARPVASTLPDLVPSDPPSRPDPREARGV